MRKGIRNSHSENTMDQEQTEMTSNDEKQEVTPEQQIVKEAPPERGATIDR